MYFILSQSSTTYISSFSALILQIPWCDFKSRNGELNKDPVHLTNLPMRNSIIIPIQLLQNDELLF